MIGYRTEAAQRASFHAAGAGGVALIHPHAAAAGVDKMESAGTIQTEIERRVERLAWPKLEAALDERGFALIPALLRSGECAAVAAMYGHRDLFRSRVEMARFRFGLGEYKYFAAPLPPLVAALRASLYLRLAPIATRWSESLRIGAEYPATLDRFLHACRAAGQTRPTPLVLRYAAGGYNCMHQDLYGEVFFPLQATVMLSRPEIDFAGGEFLLAEQRPRAQSRVEAIRLERGMAIVFATRWRPARGVRNVYRAAVRHGVSTVARGGRTTLGVIFHDAR